MVHVVGASSLCKAVETLPHQVRKTIQSKVIAIPGLSLNPLLKNPLTNLEYLLTKGHLSKQYNLVLWHDLLNNTISAHPKHKTPALNIRSLGEVLDRIKHRLSAIVYCRRFGTADIYKELKASGVTVISVRKNLQSKRKQSDSNLQLKLSALHPESKLELKSLNIILKHGNKLKDLAKNTRSRKNKPSQKKRKARQQK